MFERLAVTLCAVALLFGASACGKESVKPKPLDSSSESSSPTESAAPSLPPEALQKNEAGVKATVRAFAEAKGHAGNTGETSQFEALYTSECTLCAGATKAVKDTYNSGGRYINAGWTIQAIKVKGIEDDLAFVELTVDTQDNQWIPKADAQPRSFPGRKGYPEFLQLRWVGSEQWKVAAWNPDR
jgi:hypothetical protein